jgi:hypothetical protein
MRFLKGVDKHINGSILNFAAKLLTSVWDIIAAILYGGSKGFRQEPATLYCCYTNKLAKLRQPPTTQSFLGVAVQQFFLEKRALRFYINDPFFARSFLNKLN